jgi:hypothetical protein
MEDAYISAGFIHACHAPVMQCRRCRKCISTTEVGSYQRLHDSEDDEEEKEVISVTVDRGFRFLGTISNAGKNLQVALENMESNAETLKVMLKTYIEKYRSIGSRVGQNGVDYGIPILKIVASATGGAAVVAGVQKFAEELSGSARAVCEEVVERSCMDVVACMFPLEESMHRRQDIINAFIKMRNVLEAEDKDTNPLMHHVLRGIRQNAMDKWMKFFLEAMKE